MIRFCIIYRDKLKKVLYKFVCKVFNFPSARNLSDYNSLGGNKVDGILYSVLGSIQTGFGILYNDDEWHWMFSLKVDACYISNKVTFNYHTNKLIVFCQCIQRQRSC